MIRTLDLQGYRGFESFRLRDLKRVNLLVGRNNCGKTSILEAIDFLISKGDPSVLNRSAVRRGEIVSPDMPEEPEVSPKFYRESPNVSHLFCERRLEAGTGFRISSDEHGMVSAELLTMREAEKEWNSNDTHADILEMLGPRHALGFGLRIAGSVPEGVLPLPVTDNGMLYPLSTIRILDLWSRKALGDRTVQLLTPGSFSCESIRYMWNRVLTEGRESEIIEAMKLLESDLDSIHFLSDKANFGRVMVGLRGGGHCLPLGSFGDGMGRLLALSLFLVTSANGFLLVDEIDTGLHFSVMEEMWKLVVSTARKSDVQVFATTHSHDCIEGLSALVDSAPEFASEISVQKIENSLAESVNLGAEEVQVALRQEIEIR